MLTLLVAICRSTLERLVISCFIFHKPHWTQLYKKLCVHLMYLKVCVHNSPLNQPQCTVGTFLHYLLINFFNKPEIKEVLSGEIRPAYHVLWLLHTVRNLSMHINARSALESAGFLPELIRFLKRTDEFTEEEKGNVNHSDERENVTLTVSFVLQTSTLCFLSPSHSSRSLSAPSLCFLCCLSLT